MRHLGTRTLETKRLILRQFKIEDAVGMYKNWASDHEVTKYLKWKTHESIDESLQVISSLWLPSYKELNFYHWVIEVKDIGEPIGYIGVSNSDDFIKSVHIYYCIGKSWWYKGYASEALRRLVMFFFEEVKVNRIESRYDSQNPNSGKVLIKSGFRYEGTSRQSDWNNQGIYDAVNYAMLAEDYLSSNIQKSSVMIN